MNTATATKPTSPPTPRAPTSSAWPIRPMSETPTVTRSPAETFRPTVVPSSQALRVTNCMVS